MIINPKDNVEIRDDGHKYALRDIAEGENVITSPSRRASMSTSIT